MPLGFVAAATVIGAGVSLYTANQAHGIASSQMDMAHQIFNEQQYYEQQLQQLIANPSSVTKLPGYSFNLQQGAETVARQMGASGFSGSGNEASALTRYGQDYATNMYQTQVGILSQLAGITAPSSPAQAGSVAVGANQNAAQQFAALAGGISSLAGYYGSAGSPGVPPPSSDTGSTNLVPAGPGSPYLINAPGGTQ